MMMKRITAAFLFVALTAIFCYSTVAAAGNVEFCFDYHYAADHATVFGRDVTTEGELLIPPSVDELPVYAIESSGFDGYEKIASLDVPEPLNTIGAAAFKDCVNLRNIKIASSVKHIAKDAFLNCGYYNDVNNWDRTGALYIDDILIRVSPVCVGTFHVKEGTRIIADGAFEGCTGITDVSIPSSVEFVGRDVFTDSGMFLNPASWTESALYVSDWLIAVKNATDFKFKEGICKIADGAFQNCDGLKTITLPEGVKRIGPFTFWGCSDLVSISIPATVEYIGDNAFTHCNLNEIYVHPDNSVYTVYDDILYSKDFKTAIKCPKNRNKAVVLHDKTLYIGNSAFLGCNQLAKVDLSPGLIGIGRSAFTECYSVEKFDLPELLRRIGQFAFSNCNRVKSIIIPDGVTILEENAFSCCLGLEKVQIGSEVKEIKAWTFEYCENLNDVIFHNDVQKIGYLSFFETALIKDSSNYDDHGLLIIDNYLIKAKDNECGIYDIPDGVTLIASNCFEDCNAVEHIILPKSLKYINFGGLSADDTIEKITFCGTESEWYSIDIDSRSAIHPEEGIRMIPDFPVTSTVIVCNTAAIALTSILITYKREKEI